MKYKATGIEYSMEFEHALMQILGEDAYQTASGAFNEQYVRKWLLKATKKIRKDILLLDTTTRHKERLLDDVDDLEEGLKKVENNWSVIFKLFFLCSRLLGYDWGQGVKYHQAFYYQTQNRIQPICQVG